MFFELLIGIFTVLIVWDYLNKKRRNEVFKQNGFSGPRNLPLIGGVLHFFGQNSETVFNMLNEDKAKYGKTWFLWSLHEAAIMSSDVKTMEALLSSQQAITKNSLYNMLSSWLGTGLLLSTGKKWHSRRKIITPTFHFKILEEFVEIFDQQSDVMVKKLSEKADGKTAVNIFPVVCLTALDIIAETAMGVKVNAQLAPDFPYVKSVTNVAEITAERFLRPLQRFDASLRITAPATYKRLTDSIDLMHDFTDKVIEERRMTLEKSIADGSYRAMTDDADVGSKKRMALLDVLLQSTVGGSSLSNQDIREEVDTFMFEGHDTTTSGMSHTLYLISRHPEVQKKLFQEILEVIGDDRSKPITMRELQDLKYLECVIKEGLRLYPPVPMIGRHFAEDIVLNGKLFPANSDITVLIFQALRDPDYFTDPEAFKPERFSNDSTEKVDPFAYVPFSAGPRNCIGQKYAILEMKSTISKVLRHFELLPLGKEVQSMVNLILRSSTGVNLGLKPRAY